MGSDSVFGKIIRGELPADKVFENERVLAFRDINPAAPTHVLVIPKKAIRNAGAAESVDEALLGELVLTAARVARQEGIAGGGYRIVMNVGSNGGESVPHLDLHVLGGRQHL